MIVTQPHGELASVGFGEFTFGVGSLISKVVLPEPNVRDRASLVFFAFFVALDVLKRVALLFYELWDARQVTIWTIVLVVSFDHGPGHKFQAVFALLTAELDSVVAILQDGFFPSYIVTVRRIVRTFIVFVRIPVAPLMQVDVSAR